MRRSFLATCTQLEKPVTITKYEVKVRGSRYDETDAMTPSIGSNPALHVFQVPLLQKQRTLPTLTAFCYTRIENQVEVKEHIYFQVFNRFILFPDGIDLKNFDKLEDNEMTIPVMMLHAITCWILVWYWGGKTISKRCVAGKTKLESCTLYTFVCVIVRQFLQIYYRKQLRKACYNAFLILTNGPPCILVGK